MRRGLSCLRACVPRCARLPSSNPPCPAASSSSTTRSCGQRASWTLRPTALTRRAPRPTSCQTSLCEGTLSPLCRQGYVVYCRVDEKSREPRPVPDLPTIVGVRYTVALRSAYVSLPVYCTSCCRPAGGRQVYTISPFFQCDTRVPCLIGSRVLILFSLPGGLKMWTSMRALLVATAAVATSAAPSWDVVVYGSTPAGVAAA